MDAARDPYSKINPDSPWRWVPVATMMIASAALVAWDVSNDRESSWISLAAVVFATMPLTLIAGSKVGSQWALNIATRKAKALGARRVNSHPTLVWGMRIVGIAMLIVFAYADPLRTPFEERTLFLRAAGSFGFVVLAGCLTAWSWNRPWDLKVVEREHAAE